MSKTECEIIQQLKNSIVCAMIDLCKNATDTVFIANNETVFERLAHLHEIAGGNKEVLEMTFPEYF
jgi:hypothetical protein